MNPCGIPPTTYAYARNKVDSVAVIAHCDSASRNGRRRPGRPESGSGQAAPQPRADIAGKVEHGMAVAGSRREEAMAGGVFGVKAGDEIGGGLL